MSARQTQSISLLRALHLAGKIIGHDFLRNRLLKGLDDPLTHLTPAQVVKHHRAGEDEGTWIDHILIGILGRCSMGRLEDGSLVPDVGAGGHAQASDLGGQGIRYIISVQIGRGQNLVLLRP